MLGEVGSGGIATALSCQMEEKRPRTLPCPDLAVPPLADLHWMSRIIRYDHGELLKGLHYRDNQGTASCRT